MNYCMYMRKDEKIVDYFSTLVTLTNQTKLYAETMSDQIIIGKFLRTLPSQFGHIVVNI